MTDLLRAARKVNARIVRHRKAGYFDAVQSRLRHSRPALNDVGIDLAVQPNREYDTHRNGPVGLTAFATASVAPGVPDMSEHLPDAGALYVSPT